MSYSYDLAGHVLTKTYPSRRTVTNAYDNAGRANTVIGKLGDGTSRTYANGINYSVFGGISREQYGTDTPLYYKTFYNIRGQMFDTRVSSVKRHLGLEPRPFDPLLLKQSHVGRKRHGQQRQRDLRGELGATTQRNP